MSRPTKVVWVLHLSCHAMRYTLGCAGWGEGPAELPALSRFFPGSECPILWPQHNFLERFDLTSKGKGQLNGGCQSSIEN